MKYIESPTESTGAGKDVKLFLAGGITGTEDWQAQVVELLKGSNLTLINPRRKDWDRINLIEEPQTVAISQILLEEKAKLAKANNSVTIVKKKFKI